MGQRVKLVASSSDRFRTPARVIIRLFVPRDRPRQRSLVALTVRDWLQLTLSQRLFLFLFRFRFPFPFPRLFPSLFLFPFLVLFPFLRLFLFLHLLPLQRRPIILLFPLLISLSRLPPPLSCFRIPVFPLIILLPRLLLFSHLLVLVNSRYVL